MSLENIMMTDAFISSDSMPRGKEPSSWERIADTTASYFSRDRMKAVAIATGSCLAAYGGFETAATAAAGGVAGGVGAVVTTVGVGMALATCVAGEAASILSPENQLSGLSEAFSFTNPGGLLAGAAGGLYGGDAYAKKGASLGSLAFDVFNMGNDLGELSEGLANQSNAAGSKLGRSAIGLLGDFTLTGFDANDSADKLTGTDSAAISDADMPGKGDSSLDNSAQPKENSSYNSNTPNDKPDNADKGDSTDDDTDWDRGWD